MTLATKAALIQALLFDYVSGVAAGLALPVAWPEVTFEPEAGDDGQMKPFLRVDLFTNRPAWEGVAAGRLDQGILQLTVVWPAGAGIVQPTIIAGQILSNFPKAMRLSANDVRVKITAEPWIASPITESDRASYPITITWAA